MKITIKKALDEDDYRNALTITTDKGVKLSFFDGEPEDANLARDFKDVYRITDLCAAVYDAAKAGEELEVEAEQVTWDEI